MGIYYYINTRWWLELLIIEFRSFESRMYLLDLTLSILNHFARYG